MSEIGPFRARLYNANKVALDDVVAPPYDVISPAQQKELYAKSPYNVVRLILNKDEDRYTSSAAFLSDWQSEGALGADANPAIYVLSQQYKLPDGSSVDRRGFIAACRLEEFGKGSVYPHEKTLAKPKEDRLKLFLATHIMCSQIFSIYSDPEKVLDKRIETIMIQPPYARTVLENVLNRMWKVSDHEEVRHFTEFLKKRNVFIADGHHRYETAIAYRNRMIELKGTANGNEPFQYVPMYFANMHSDGLVILPTHRLVHGLPSFDGRKLLDRLKEKFILEPVNSENDLISVLQKRKEMSFGLVLSKPDVMVIISANAAMCKEIELNPSIVERLDVSVLHNDILRNVLNISEEQQEKKLYLDYEKDALKAIWAVREERAQAAFLMNPTPVESVRAVAEAGLVMPQKSTYFYPKLLSGLVNYSFSEE